MKIAIILMAGKGNRMGLDIPKQYVTINKKPLFAYSLTSFYKSKNIDSILLVVDKQHYSYVKEYISVNNLDNKVQVCLGGETRKQSVLNGIIYLGNSLKEDDIILVHDSARPLVNEEIIEENIAKCNEFGVAVTAIDVSDTVLQTDFEGKVSKYLDRKLIKQVQTPQTFKYKLFEKVKSSYEDEGQETDDSIIFYNEGFDIHFVQGSVLNFKVTTGDDLTLFKILLKEIIDINK